MFERFTQRARQIVIRAQDIARLHKHNQVRIEHLLLAITADDECTGSLLLAAMGVDPPSLRREIEDSIGEGESIPTGHLPYLRPAVNVFEIATRESVALEHAFTGSEHFVLGILLHNDSISARLLTGHGMDAKGTRAEIVRMASNPPDDR